MDGTIVFIRVEGRDDRGTGMDFIQLGQLCQVLHISDAINLDGGGSSRMSWKEPGKMIINIAGSNLDAYPVGGVLSFAKK
jgi:exopolysaccharide biosynthesis protein